MKQRPLNVPILYGLGVVAALMFSLRVWKSLLGAPLVAKPLFMIVWFSAFLLALLIHIAPFVAPLAILFVYFAYRVPGQKKRTNPPPARKPITLQRPPMQPLVWPVIVMLIAGVVAVGYQKINGRIIAAHVVSRPITVADTYTFNATPKDARLSVRRGDTAGWGYVISNQSARYWLQPTTLNASSFSEAQPLTLFDYPAIPPGQTVAQAYDAAQRKGLYEVKIPANGTPGHSNGGSFALSADWWDGDPLNGGKRISPAPDMATTYMVTAQ